MTAHAFGTHYRCRCGHAYGVDLGEHGCPKCDARRPARLVTPKPLVRKTPLVASSKPMRQFRKNRRPGNSAQTKAESVHVAAVKAAGCICCIKRGYAWGEDGAQAEAHHLLSGSIRKGHEDTVGLCNYHHRGVKAVDGWSIEMHRRLLGPSLMDGSVPFHATFGSDEDLMAFQRELLAGRAAA